MLAQRRGWRAAKTLDVRLARFEWQLPTRTTRGLPVWPEATVAATERPAAPCHCQLPVTSIGPRERLDRWNRRCHDDDHPGVPLPVLSGTPADG